MSKKITVRSLKAPGINTVPVLQCSVHTSTVGITVYLRYKSTTNRIE